MIKTTHVGSLPRPAAMITRQLKKEALSENELRAFIIEVMERQTSIGLSAINNGELPRADYVSATVERIAGFNGQGSAPLARDMAELPEYSRKFSGRNGLITLNPKAPIALPACSEELVYTGEAGLRHELEMMVDARRVVHERTGLMPEMFFTAPSPGTVALFFENRHYPDYETYLTKIGEIMQREYEIIDSYGVQLQIDCPDLAMGRHTRFSDLDEKSWLDLIELHIEVVNKALTTIDLSTCRAHICWGNYPGTHHCDIGLAKIMGHINRLAPRAISLESCNHRHAHEWEILRDIKLAEDKILLPGVIDTTSNTIEHPELVATRICNFAGLLGADRVVACTDCGFASTGSAVSVTGEVAWLKLAAMVEGVRLAEKRLGI